MINNFVKRLDEGESPVCTVIKETGMGFVVMIVACISSVGLSVLFSYVSSLITKL